MPEHTNNYSPPLFLFNGHLETIYPALFRNVKAIPSQFERIHTDDGDFLDLYWNTQGSKTLAIISHGLEGNATRPYVLGMVSACYSAGFDVLTWNFRGCGMEMNKLLRFYHSGATEDLEAVVNHAVRKGYNHINLIGFSLGGNLTLKYLGERRALPPQLHKAVTISVPMDLYTSCVKISLPSNTIYSRRFLKSLKEKVIRKSRMMEGIDISSINKIKTLIEFDDHFTAPLHGFKNARHYYDSCSAIHFVKNISLPTLIINAKNDPFLGAGCFPEEMLQSHPYVKFLSPNKGGHVGFAAFSAKGLYWSEQRTLDYLQTNG